MAELTAAILLAGGSGRRLGGVDKPALLIDGTALVERALSAVGSVVVVVVGPDRELSRPVLRAREDPPGAGPAAAVAAGAAQLRALLAADDLVAVLATDLPAIAPGTLARLTTAVGRADGVVDGGVLVADGQEQLLLGVWRFGSLLAAVAARPDWTGASVRGLLSPLTRVQVPAIADEAADIDTPDHLTRWLATGHQHHAGQ